MKKRNYIFSLVSVWFVIWTFYILTALIQRYNILFAAGASSVTSVYAMLPSIK